MNSSVLPSARNAPAAGLPDNHARRASREEWLGIAAAAMSIVWLWRQNANKLGSFFDYSIPIYANNFLNHGWLPYHDFSTPLQTLPFLLGDGFERVFGQHYSSMALCNLALTFALFGVCYLLTRRAMPIPMALFVALTICLGSSLQHGMVWYNTVGLLWPVAATLVACAAIRRGHLRTVDVIQFALLLLASGMTKLSYHAATLAVVYFGLACLYLRYAASLRKLAVFGLGLTVWAVAAPVLTELLITGATFQQWLQQVIITPSARAGYIALLGTSLFWIGHVRPFYYGSAYRGIFALALVIFGFVAIRFGTRHDTGFGVRLRLEPVAEAARRYRIPQAAFLLPVAALATYFALAAFIAVMNVDLPSIGECLLIVGLAAVLAGFGPDLTPASRRAIQTGLLVFTLLFFAAGMKSLYSHARLQHADTKPHETFAYQVTSDTYLKGVYLSVDSRRRLEEAREIVARYGIGPDSDEVYWGLGIEIFSREFRTRPHPGFPLFWQPVARNEADVPAMITRLEASPVRLFVMDPYYLQQFAAGLLEHLQRQWQPHRTAALLYFVRPGTEPELAPAP